MNFLDSQEVNGTRYDLLGVDTDRIYPGTDLTVKFAAEIKGYSDAWAWIKARIKAGNYAGIHVSDYIPFTTTNSVTMKAQVAGINTYTNYGDSQVGNHIDFITQELWPTNHVMNPVNWNNGLIPVEKLSGDGTTTAFTLTKQMSAVDNILVGGEQVTAFSYDASTFTVTFDEAPASGSSNITVTGTGTQYPWLASDLYLYLNSLAGQVPNSTDNPPNTAVKHVDYTKDGVYYYLPQALKNVITNKRALLPQRYSASGKLSTNNTWGWQDAGNLWVPSEIEVAGCAVWGGGGYDAGGFVQYPIFNACMNRAKKRSGSRYLWWTLSASSGNATHFGYGSSNGVVGSSSASSTWLSAPVCFRVS